MASCLFTLLSAVKKILNIAPLVLHYFSIFCPLQQERTKRPSKNSFRVLKEHKDKQNWLDRRSPPPTLKAKRPFAFKSSSSSPSQILLHPAATEEPEKTPWVHTIKRVRKNVVGNIHSCKYLWKDQRASLYPILKMNSDFTSTM